MISDFVGSGGSQKRGENDGTTTGLSFTGTDTLLDEVEGQYGAGTERAKTRDFCADQRAGRIEKMSVIFTS